MSKKNIRNAVRRYLLEGKDDTHDYGCVMLYLKFKDKDWKSIQNMIADKDIYTEEGDLGYGREDSPHVTVLYGLHADIPDSTIKELIDEMKAPTISLNKIGIFENDKFDVIKFTIIGRGRKELGEMNAKFAKLPHTTDYPDYTPHITLAYVKAGTGKDYKQTLDNVIQPEIIEVVYSKADGSEKKYKIK